MRNHAFRVAVREFKPFESAIRKQWEIFEQRTRTGLTLEIASLDLRSLHEDLFLKRGLERGDYDVAFVSTDWLAEAVKADSLVDLSPYLQASPPEGYPDAWTESLLRFQRFGNRVLGLPYHDGPECLIYRRDLFEDAAEGKRYARQFGEPLQPPRSWREFHRLARFFTRPQQPLYGTVFAAFPDGHNTVYDFCLQLWTRGGELFDASGQILLNTPQASEALDYYRDLLNDSTAVHPGSRQFDSVRSGLAFARGEVAMMVNWFGFAAMSETLDESKARGRVSVAPAPCETGLPVSLNAYWILGIAPGSMHRDPAWGFLSHCASAAMDKLLTLEGGIGCRKSTWIDAQVNAAVPFYSCLERLHHGARELPRLTNWERLGTVIEQMVLDAVQGYEPIGTITQKAQSRGDTLTRES